MGNEPKGTNPQRRAARAGPTAETPRGALGKFTLTSVQEFLRHWRPLGDAKYSRAKPRNRTVQPFFDQKWLTNVAHIT